MTGPENRARLADILLDQDDFSNDLAGYAGMAAAAELCEHWSTCDPPLPLAEKLTDIEQVIVGLRRWRARVADNRPIPE